MSPFLDRFQPFQPAAEKRLFWLRQAFRLLAITLAGLHAWAAAVSHSMNPDGVAYLDIGDAYFRGDWEMAINTVWSPLYSWVLGAVMCLFEPPMRWEFPTVHLVNFVIFLLALVAFEFMWKRLLPVSSGQYSVSSEENGLAEGQVGLPGWAWWSVGYLLFIWATLTMIQMWAVTPDMLMAAFVFWAAGLVAQIRHGPGLWRQFALLGCVLGLGYLSKSIMLPVSVFFLTAVFLAAAIQPEQPRVNDGGPKTEDGGPLFRPPSSVLGPSYRVNWQQAVIGTAVSLVCFLLVAGPFVAVMSVANGRFTYGDAGKFTYVRHVNHVVYPHWQGEPPGDGVPLHPSRQIFDDPPIYEFGSPIGGTYPISFDQSYWYAGVEVRFDLANQLRQLLASALFYADLFIFQQAAVLLGLALLCGLRRRGRFSMMGSLRGWLLSGVGLLALLLYAPILVAGRYVGAFVLLFWSDLLAQVRVPDTAVVQRVTHSVSLLMILFLFVNIALFNLQGFADLSGGSEPPAPTETAGPPDWPGAVAAELWQLGIEPGDEVAVIGYAFDSYWARLARVQIVAETLGWQADALWLGDSVFQQEVLGVFASTGARAIVAEYVPAYADVSDWHQVGNSNFYIYLLDQEY